MLLGNGAGSFGAATNFATDGFPRSIAIADMNGDGCLDVVTANGGYGTASVLLGNGAGAFAGHSEYGAGNLAISASVGDLNADGRLDMVVANRCLGAVRDPRPGADAPR